MPRIYTEIRIAHKSEELKKEFEQSLKVQSQKLLGKEDNAEYVRQIVNLDAATNLIEIIKKESNK